MHYGGATPSGERSPVNAAERRLRKMLLAAGFPEATSWQEQQHLGSGLGTTTPDAIYRPDDDELRPVAIYLDGLSNHLHGNPQTAERDRIIRAQLREMDWEVISVTAHELHDQGNELRGLPPDPARRPVRATRGRRKVRLLSR